MKPLGKKIASYTVAAALIAGLIFITVYLKNLADYKKAVRDISFGQINISDVSDGTYIGECDVDFIYTRVEVTVKNGEITSIVILKHKNGRGKAAEAVLGEIVARQKVDVDAISGATNSSAVLKKAVENALKNGL